MQQTLSQSCGIVEQDTNLGTPVELDYVHSLKRQYAYAYPGKPTFFYSSFTGQVILPSGKTGMIPPGTSLTTLLEKIEGYTHREYGDRKRVVALCIVSGRAIKNRPHKEWFHVYRGWKQDTAFWNKLQARYTHDNFTVYLYGTGSYFGEEKNLDAIYEAWKILEQKLPRLFHADGHKVLGDTPAFTGRELVTLSIPKDQQYPRLPDDLLQLIAHNFGQARIETFPPKKQVLENGVYILDGLWMYASCVSHLPTGLCYRDMRNEFLGRYTKAGRLFPIGSGFYYATVRVPDNWYHIGLLKAPRSKTPNDDTAYYPNTPGETFTNWFTAIELALAIEKGWHVQIHERILQPHEETDPLATWRKKLVDFREEETNALVTDAIRAIFLHTIGSFHQFSTIEPRFTANEDLPIIGKPYGQMITRREGVYWNEEIPLQGVNRLRFIHPEWSATVWGRARARLASFALRLPYEDIVSFRLDSVWCASKPEWLESEYTGKPGCFREKAHIAGSWAWPVNSADMASYVRGYNLKRGDTIELVHDDYSELEQE